MNTQLLQSLRKPQTHAGTWLSLGSNITAEIAAHLQFNWVLIDLEHGTGTEAGLLQVLQAASHQKTALIVRVGHVDASLIARALDWGADGIMLPQVESVEKVKACLGHMLYPPHGSRGISGSVRAYKYGLETASLEDRPAPLFLAQIETWKGVKNANEIAAVPGVDVLFIGPTDLKADLAASSHEEEITLDACIDLVTGAASNHNKQTGIVLKTREELAAYQRKGIHFLSFGSDLLFVKEGMQRALNFFKDITE